MKFRKPSCTILAIISCIKKKNTTGYVAMLQNRILGTGRIIKPNISQQFHAVVKKTNITLGCITRKKSCKTCQ